MSRSIRITLLCLAVSIFSVPTLAETQYPLTMTYGEGQTLTLDSRPQSISSLTLFTDEILMSLVNSDRIKSMTFLAGDPVFSNVAGNIPEGMTLLDMNVEAIIQIYPDIVFVANWSDAGKVEQLRQAGIPVYLIDTPVTLESIEAEILKIAQILDVETKGQALIDDMNVRLSSLKTESERLHTKQWVALDYNSWGTASGLGTTWNEVMTHAGLINGAARYEVGDFGQVALSKEMIVSVNPDILFLPGWIYGDPEGSEKFKNQVLSDPALRDVSAIKQKRVYMIPENLRGTYSHYIVDAIQFVNSVVRTQ